MGGRISEGYFQAQNLQIIDNRFSMTVPETRALVKFCFDRGLIILACGTFGNIIRFLMTLVITEEQLDRGLAIVRDGLATFCSSSTNT